MLGSRRPLVALIVCALGLGALLPVGGAGAKTAPKKCITKPGKRAKCPKPRTPKLRSTIPVAITVLGGSHATVDLGAGNVRDVPFGGFVFAYSPQRKIDITKNITIKLLGGDVSPHATDLISDTSCGGSSVATRLGTGSDIGVVSGGAVVDPKALTVTSTVAVKLNLQFDVRPSCGAALVPAVITTTPATFTLGGKIDPPTGFTRLHIAAAPTPVTVKACLTPGGGGGVCAGPVQDLPVTIALDVFLRIDMNAGGGGLWSVPA